MPRFDSPILVVWDSQTEARLSGYVTEILHVEGYNWFTVHDLAASPIALEQLSRHAVVLLTHVAITDETISTLLDYVDQGGALITLRPPEQLASALGLQPFNRDLADRYISLNKICALNIGVDEPPLQFHGRAELYLWHGEPANVMAYFAASPEYITKHPAITVGKRGQGTWAVFAYDLAESTVLLHQGRREQASTGPYPDYDGDRSYKPNDLFVGHLDPALCSLPQADLQQDILVRILEWMTDTQPAPAAPLALSRSRARRGLHQWRRRQYVAYGLDADRRDMRPLPSTVYCIPQDGRPSKSGAGIRKRSPTAGP